MSQENAKPQYRAIRDLFSGEGIEALNRIASEGYEIIKIAVEANHTHVLLKLQAPPPDPVADSEVARLESVIAAAKAACQP